MRFYGFDEKQAKKLKLMCNNHQPCVIKQGRRGKLEILVKSYTRVEPSETMFKEDVNDGSVDMCIVNLSEFNIDDRVTVSVAVLRVKEPESVGNGKLKQEVVIADQTGKATLILWESDVNK